MSGSVENSIERLQPHVPEVDHLRYANDRLRALLARAMRHIDPNGDQAALDLLRECEEAVG